MTIIPGQTPCLRCVVESSPPPGMAPTCETAGILGPTVNIIASLQATEALKILTGQLDAINRELIMIDIWDGTFKKLKIAGLMDAVDCPTCKQRNFEWLDGKLGSHTTSLCGRNAVQIAHRAAERLSFETLERQLSPLGPVSYNRFMLKFDVDSYQFTVFPDGRAIIKGTNDINKARTLYAQYIGH
jgi:adenylyltransferase/sulfurtransferase